MCVLLGMAFMGVVYPMDTISLFAGLINKAEFNILVRKKWIFYEYPEF